MPFSRKEWIKSPEGKASKQRYYRSEKGQATALRYKSSDKGKATSKRCTRARRKNIRGIIDAAKQRPCNDCGGRFALCCMDFHHIEKWSFRIGANDHKPLAAVQAEIKKCVVICSNCHRLRHDKRSHAQPLRFGEK